MSMARRSGIPLSDILRHLDSDDDLGMDSEYEYDSDNSVEGIYIILANYTLIIILIVHTYLTKSRRQ